jgi:radical SAM superfamily enzyme YgiQ (UPF0313 family)
MNERCRRLPAPAPLASRWVPLDMNQNPPASPSSTTDTLSRPLRQPLDPKVLAAVLAGIRADSQREADSYLRDTVVPHGGE